MTIERDIQDLLREHDLVIVPGFGGLLGQRHPSRIDEARRLIHPPSKAISFNRNLVRNDGLLADHIAARRMMPHAQAVDAIALAVQAWRARLADHGRVEVPGIGTFFHDAEKNIQFEPDHRTNLLKEAFGLRSLPAVPVRANAPIVRTLEPVAGKEETGDGRIPLLWAAAAVTGILFAAGAWVLADDRISQRLQLGTFDPFGPDEPALYSPGNTTVQEFQPMEAGRWSVPPGQSGVQALPIAGPRAPLVHVDLGQPSSTDAIAAGTTPVMDPDKTRVVVSVPKNSRYHVIGGCFSVKENADRFLGELQARGFDATLIDQHHGLYRVAFGSYPDKAMALDAMSALRKEEGLDAWLLVK